MSSSSSSSDEDQPEEEAVTLHLAKEETVKLATIQTLESIPVEEESEVEVPESPKGELISVTVSTTDPVDVVEYTTIPERKMSSSSSSSDEDQPEEEAVTLHLAKEETVKLATIQTVESIPVEEESEVEVPESPKGELISVTVSTTDPVDVVEYTTIPERKCLPVLRAVMRINNLKRSSHIHLARKKQLNCNHPDP
ncbi:titin-like [Clytia hemisphaerica]|uniref:titin-like n=1 Tax=Clytia hemisphaerica TaxID=252671 RepID=UPI0034D6FEB3